MPNSFVVARPQLTEHGEIAWLYMTDHPEGPGTIESIAHAYTGTLRDAVRLRDEYNKVNSDLRPMPWVVIAVTIAHA